MHHCQPPTIQPKKAQKMRTTKGMLAAVWMLHGTAQGMLDEAIPRPSTFESAGDNSHICEGVGSMHEAVNSTQAWRPTSA